MKGLLIRIKAHVHDEHFIIASLEDDDDVNNNDTIWLHQRKMVCRAVKVFKNGSVDCYNGGASPFFRNDDEPYSKVLMTNKPLIQFAPLTINDLNMVHIPTKDIRNAFAEFKDWVYKYFDYAKIEYSCDENKFFIKITEVGFDDINKLIEKIGKNDKTRNKRS